MMQDDWGNAVRREPKVKLKELTEMWVLKGTANYLLCPLILL